MSAGLSEAPADLDLVARLRLAATHFADEIAARPGVRRIEAPDFRERARSAGTLAKPVIWTNELFEGPEFRWAHVEYFCLPEQFGVVHVCLFPRLDAHAPIFGFDIVSGRAKATGAFLDLSPTTRAADVSVAAWAAETAAERAAFAEPRALPEWAAPIFSAHALAIRPQAPDEVDAVIGLAQSSLARWFKTGTARGPAAPMLAAQQRYVAQQRRNEHTLRMLAGCIGRDLAREFIDDWLFPEA